MAAGTGMATTSSTTIFCRLAPALANILLAAFFCSWFTLLLVDFMPDKRASTGDIAFLVPPVATAPAQMDGWMVGCMEGWRDGGMHGGMVGCMEGYMVYLSGTCTWQMICSHSPQHSKASNMAQATP